MNYKCEPDQTENNDLEFHFGLTSIGVIVECSGLLFLLVESFGFFTLPFTQGFWTGSVAN